jgi:excisionase family DNA binding protein
VRNIARMRTEPKKLAVNIRDAADMIGVSMRTVQQYIAEGILPTKRIGRRRVITLAALEDFLRIDHTAPARKEM